MRGGLVERPPTAHSSGRMLPREMRTDVMPGASCASSPADESVEAAPVPTLPTQDVLPKAVGALTHKAGEHAHLGSHGIAVHQRTPPAQLGPQSPSDEQNPV